MSMDWETRLGPLPLENPIIASAGTFGYGEEFEAFFRVNRLGALIVKTLTRQPRAGNPAPRVVETPSGMLNAVGLQNVGMDAFRRDLWPRLSRLGCPIIISVAGFSTDEFGEMAGLASELRPAAVELNLSCPNVAHGDSGRCFAQSPELTGAAVRAARRATTLPLLAKLSADTADVPAVAKAALAGGADILTLINTIPGMVVDVDRAVPFLANRTGGLSGPAIRPISVRCIADVFQATRAPILGVGGVLTGRDAVELLMAGAAAVGVGTASFWDPAAAPRVLRQLGEFLEAKSKSLQEIIGCLHPAHA